MRKTTQLISVALLTLPSLCLSGQMGPVKQKAICDNIWSFSLGVGYLEGMSKEYVFDNGTTISRLDWDIEQVPILKGEISVNFPRLTASFSGWVNLWDGSAVMDDYDWLNPFQAQFTDWSHHENTKLSWGNNFDFNLKGWILQNNTYQVGLLGGYLRNAFGFLANQGCFYYNNFTLVGCDPDTSPAIAYKQEFNTPYVGLAGSYLWNNFEIQGVFKGSSWVRSQDLDIHFNRHLIFVTKAKNQNFYAAELTAGYFVTPHSQVFINGSYTYYVNKIGDVDIEETTTGATISIPDSGGLTNRNFNLAIGLRYLV